MICRINRRATSIKGIFRDPSLRPPSKFQGNIAAYSSCNPTDGQTSSCWNHNLPQEKESPAGCWADLQLHSCQHSLARGFENLKKCILPPIKTRGTGCETCIYLPNQSRLRQQLFALRPDASEMVDAGKIIPTAATNSRQLHIRKEDLPGGKTPENRGSELIRI